MAAIGKRTDPTSPTSQTLPFVIERLGVSPASNLPREISLTGRGLPYQGAAWTTSQRVTTEWSQGSRQATQQVLGPTLPPSTFAGTWKDRYLGGVGTARQLAQLFDDICARGERVRVSWGATAFGAGSDLRNVDPTVSALGDTELQGSPIIREGVISNFKRTFRFPQWVEWEMTFAWSSDGTPAIVNLSAGGVSLSTSQGRLAESLEDLERLSRLDSQLAGRIGSVDVSLQDSLGEILGATGRIRAESEAAAERSQDISSISAADAVLGESLSRQSAALARRTKDIFLQNEAKALGPYDDVASSLTDGNRYLEQIRSFDQLEVDSTRSADGFGASVRSDTQAIVDAVIGTDLREIAIEVYGDADAWPAIAHHNGLSRSDVPTPPQEGEVADTSMEILVPYINGATDPARSP